MRKLVAAAAAVLLTCGAAGAASAAPADGNGRKEIIVVEEYGIPIECDDGTWLTFDIVGHAQVIPIETERTQVVIQVHIDWVFGNGEETWIFRDRGIDREFVVDGELYVAQTGRSASFFPEARIGRSVLTGEFPPETLFSAGRTFDIVEEACAALG